MIKIKRARWFSVPAAVSAAVSVVVLSFVLVQVLVVGLGVLSVLSLVFVLIVIQD